MCGLNLRTGKVGQVSPFFSTQELLDRTEGEQHRGAPSENQSAKTTPTDSANSE